MSTPGPLPDSHSGEEPSNRDRSGAGRADRTTVRASLLEICEHFAGEPRSSSEDSKGKVRYVFTCPGCAKGTFTVILFPDATPPGSGSAGCSNKTCPVPPKRDAVGVVEHFCGLRGKGKLDRALAHATEILRGEKALGPVDQELPFEEPAGPFPTRPVPPDPEYPPDDGTPGPSLPDHQPDAGDPDAEYPARPFDRATSAPRWARRPGHAQDNDPSPSDGRCREDREDEDLHAASDFRVPPDLHEELDLRHLVYDELLTACTPGSGLIEYFAARGVSEAVVRGGAVGAYSPEGADELLRRLSHRIGRHNLVLVPGFDLTDSGTLRHSLGAEAAALVGCRDARGRIIAVEVLPLATPDQPRLLGGGPGGRDLSLGGAHHLWTPDAGPAGTQAITDSILEAMRVSSAGVPCAGLRGPGAFCAPAGAALLPELAGVCMEATSVLYAPSSTDRSRAAAPKAARATIANCGARAIVLGNPPYVSGGLGTYLLSHPPTARGPLFESLFAARHSTVVADGRAGVSANPPVAGGSLAVSQRSHGQHPARPEEDGPLQAAADRATFLARQSAKSIHKPPAGLALQPGEAGRSLAAAGLALLVIVPPTLFVANPLVGALHTAVASMADTPAPRPGRSAEASTLDPLAAMGEAFSRIASEIVGPVSGPLASATAVLASTPAALLGALLVSALVGWVTARRIRFWRFCRIVQFEGQIQHAPEAARVRIAHERSNVRAGDHATPTSRSRRARPATRTRDRGSEASTRHDPGAGRSAT